MLSRDELASMRQVEEQVSQILAPLGMTPTSGSKLLDEVDRLRGLLAEITACQPGATYGQRMVIPPDLWGRICQTVES